MSKSFKRINLNILAKEVAEMEGKKKQQDIAQIKETIKVIFMELYAKYSSAQILDAIERTAFGRGKK